jgi:hypothetical protein
MKATLNDKPVEVPPQCAAFREILDYIEQEKLPAGHVLTRIAVDGAELDEDSELALLDRPCSSIGSVEFESARAVDLAREGLEQALEMLPLLAEALKDSADLLRGGQTAAGLDLLYECLGQIEWYIGLIAALDVYFTQLIPGFDPDEELLDGLGSGLGATDGATVELRTFASVENLRNRLVEAQRLQQKNDLAQLADVLEHEVLPIVKLWVREAPLLLRKVAREGAVA